MIAELFYPKELKDIIADLRAKDDLNEDILDNLNRYIYRALLLFMFIFLLFSTALFSSKADWGIGAMVFSFLPLVLFAFRYSLDSDANKVLYLYNFGEKNEGICVSYGRGYHRANFAIEAQFELDGLTKLSRLNAKDTPRKSNFFRTGDPILIFYDPRNPDKNVPFVPSVARLFYLRKGEPPHEPKNSEIKL